MKNKTDKILIYEEVKAEQEKRNDKTAEQEKDNLLKFIAELKKLNRTNIIFLNSQVDSLNNLSNQVLNLNNYSLDKYSNTFKILADIEQEFKDTKLYQDNIIKGKI